MSYLLDTSVLVRLANDRDPLYQIADDAVFELHRNGELLHLTPQVLIEFRNVATRPLAANGLGLSAADAAIAASDFESVFPVLPKHPAFSLPGNRSLPKPASLESEFTTLGLRPYAT